MMAQKKVNIAGVPFYEEELKMLKRSTGETAATDKFIELLENAMYGEKKEMYNFSDFCIDREILSKEMACCVLLHHILYSRKKIILL